MPDLATFQAQFAKGLALRAGPTNAMTVYRNTTLHGTVEALRANYPVVAAIIGDQMFSGIAAEYSESCPPISPVLADYGRGFADWIEYQPWAADISYLPDVARFERLHIEALFAADNEPLTTDMIATTGADDWTQVRLRLHPAARFGWATTPAMSIWLAHQRPAKRLIDPDWHAEGGLFVRPFGQVAAHPLKPAAHRFLFGIRLGETIGSSALATVALYPKADIGGLFAFLLACGCFAAPTSNERISA
jgi:Putative DNA-binding domain